LGKATRDWESEKRVMVQREAVTTKYLIDKTLKISDVKYRKNAASVV